MTPLKVAIDARLIGGSQTGDSTYWTCLTQELAKLGSEIQLLLVSNAARPSGIPDSANVSWLTVPAKSNRWWSYVGFPLAARRNGADVIHTQYSLSPLAGRCGVTTIHDVSFFVQPEWFKPRDRFILRRTVPASARRAARVITVSETSKGEIEHFIPAVGDKVRSVYNACPPWIEPTDRDASLRLVRDKYRIKKPYLLTVGTRWPRKNQSLATEAFRIASEAHEIQMVVVGKAGWGEEDLPAKTIATGFVLQEDLSALYAAAELFLIPSWHEGFGIPMLEAWRCGCPVLTSVGGALPEIAGDAAKVEPSWEPEDWASTIGQLLGDAGTLSEMRRLGREREKTFSWERAARETMAVYREVAR